MSCFPKVQSAAKIDFSASPIHSFTDLKHGDLQKELLNLSDSGEFTHSVSMMKMLESHVIYTKNGEMTESKSISEHRHDSVGWSRQLLTLCA